MRENDNAYLSLELLLLEAFVKKKKRKRKNESMKKWVRKRQRT